MPVSSGVLSSFKAACPKGTICAACATAVETVLGAAIGVSATTGAEVSRYNPATVPALSDASSSLEVSLEQLQQ